MHLFTSKTERVTIIFYFEIALLSSKNKYRITTLLKYGFLADNKCHRTCAQFNKKDVGAECRHDMRPSVQLPSVSGVDSILGLAGVWPSSQSALDGLIRRT